MAVLHCTALEGSARREKTEPSVLKREGEEEDEAEPWFNALHAEK
jgi:hypothetical protein